MPQIQNLAANTALIETVISEIGVKVTTILQINSTGLQVIQYYIQEHTSSQQSTNLPNQTFNEPSQLPVLTHDFIVDNLPDSEDTDPAEDELNHQLDNLQQLLSQR